MAAIIEQNHDDAGIIWPGEISPYKTIVLPLEVTRPEIMEKAYGLYARLDELGIETLLDDRDERAGVKFKDADLLGIPLQVIIGKGALGDGTLELKIRRSQEKIIKPKDEALKEIKRIIEVKS